ncbi:hypothetical protein Bca52824_033421 [Brassica carinata]|uniref:Uncharacterized protein n=1 Tax=Brassica carinata TaxID=52824 RepID=A0A8X7V616_BRACI|nr:hypothetical protein Bca52824_033421 [Brassica carinata]
MSSSQNEKKNSDVEMREASPVLLIPAVHEATPTFVARFLSFKERISRRGAEPVYSTHAKTSAILSSSTVVFGRRKQVSGRGCTSRRHGYGTGASVGGLGSAFGFFHYTSSNS